MILRTISVAVGVRSYVSELDRGRRNPRLDARGGVALIRPADA